ncbi:general secretion pathway protein GspF [Pedobacter quisquiliarum]|uniref:General secretion pathway protein F n=1 Tax=Pedobacter quisquiliarum TaxID=1834438 RepID=A0A916XHL6_9SPHI|nr:type II secretion system F family protein [Pedobacter quisquiliarum]GGC72723.1 general secretion pathway protein GspF [Pedobacter quisquiliarum]
MEIIDISDYKRVNKGEAKPSAKGGENNFSDKLSDVLSRDIRFGSGQLPDQKKEDFFFELSTLLKSGIDLKNSLDLLTIEGSGDKYLAVYKKIKEAVIAGISLSKAVSLSTKFSEYDVLSIQIGEETGNLAIVMEELGGFYKRKVDQRRKIASALTYPAIVLTTSFGAVFFMLRFVVPMFSDVFRRFGGELPWMTKLVISASGLMSAIVLPFMLSIGVLIYVYFRYKNQKKVRAMLSRLVLAIPVVKDLVLKIYLARFCNTMQLLISSRIPLLKAISLSRKTIGFYPLEVALEKTEVSVMSGRSLHDSLSDFSVFPAKMVQLVKVGEEINKLEDFFKNLGDQYVQEVEYQTNTLSKLIEPLIIIFLGLVVGFILISMYLPMFQMSNSF